MRDAERYTLDLGKVAYHTPGRRDHAVTLELELRQTPKGTEVSICGNVWNRLRTDIVSGGQNVDTIRELFPASTRVQRICALWDRWHLNTMKPGTPVQEAAVKAWLAEGHRYDYTAACEYLKTQGLYEDHGYRYGTAWLTEEAPAEVLDELRALFTTQPDTPAPEPDEPDPRDAFKGITMTTERADSNPNMPDSGDMTHYRCTLRHGAKRMTVYFSMGRAHTRPPHVLKDVLHCLAMDAAGFDNARGFADWCAEYGYDTDSRKAKRTYQAVQGQASDLRRFLGAELYAALLADA